MFAVSKVMRQLCLSIQNSSIHWGGNLKSYRAVDFTTYAIVDSFLYRKRKQKAYVAVKSTKWCKSCFLFNRFWFLINYHLLNFNSFQFNERLFPLWKGRFSDVSMYTLMLLPSTVFYLNMLVLTRPQRMTHQCVIEYLIMLMTSLSI